MRWLNEISIVAFPGILDAKVGGTEPASWLEERLRYLKFKPPKSAGSDPFNKLDEMSRTWRD